MVIKITLANVSWLTLADPALNVAAYMLFFLLIMHYKHLITSSIFLICGFL